MRFHVAIGVALLTACAGAPPLPESAEFAAEVELLTQPADRGAMPDLPPHPIALEDGLDETEAAMLAVANNPELAAARAAAGVADAQLYAVGLLPDPRFSVSGDRPTNGLGLVTAYSLGLDYDLSSLITYPARRAAALSTRDKVRLDLVWSEWQVVQQARVLLRKLCHLARQRQLLKDYQALFADRYVRSAQALADGNITLDLAGSDLVGLLDAESQLRDRELQIIEAEQAFRALLNLTPDAPLPELQAPAPSTVPDAAAIATAVAELPRRRPDLRALAAGYAAQDARLRAALLNRFPNLSLGISRARDTSALFTSGFGVSLSLPFFDGSRGAVRVERASAEQLYAEYSARLAQTRADAKRLDRTVGALQQQLSELETRLPTLEALAAQARIGADRGDSDPLIYLTLRADLLAKRIEAETRAQSLGEALVALSTLLGVPPQAWEPGASVAQHQ